MTTKNALDAPIPKAVWVDAFDDVVHLSADDEGETGALCTALTRGMYFFSAQRTIGDQITRATRLNGTELATCPDCLSMAIVQAEIQIERGRSQRQETPHPTTLESRHE